MRIFKRIVRMLIVEIVGIVWIICAFPVILYESIRTGEIVVVHYTWDEEVDLWFRNKGF